MNRKDAEKIITEYLKPIFGFALKRCKSVQDAEDLSQDIVLNAFRALLAKDDIDDTSKFIWTVAHNALSNYYRDSAKRMAGISISEISELIAESTLSTDENDNTETLMRLQSEIAYLSKLQRKIVIAYYFENRKQADIAKELDIPLGTVKWHLFEAKKELKRGMGIMRKASELKFNPIKFGSVGVNGSVGTKNPNEFFRSTLTQNICYCIRNTAKTINQIADDLGVSPVYIESEVEYLLEYGFIQSNKDKYISNFIINEPNLELLITQDEMYKKVAELFANELYDELAASKILDDPSILCEQTDEQILLTEPSHRDHNFILWSLIPYVIAQSGEKLIDNGIKFEEVSTIRPDGGENIVHATVETNNLNLPSDYVYMKNFSGPYWNQKEKNVLWQLDTDWSEKRIYVNSIDCQNADRILTLFKKEKEGGLLSKEEYAYLAERGFVKTNGDYEGSFKASWQVVILSSNEINEKLLSIGEKIKEKYKNEFEKLKAAYVKAELNTVPLHLKKIKEYEQQHIFHSDGWFIIHCIVTLLNNGKLKLPTEGQKKSLSTIIFPK